MIEKVPEKLPYNKDMNRARHFCYHRIDSLLLTLATTLVISLHGDAKPSKLSASEQPSQEKENKNNLRFVEYTETSTLPGRVISLRLEDSGKATVTLTNLASRGVSLPQRKEGTVSKQVVEKIHLLLRDPQFWDLKKPKIIGPDPVFVHITWREGGKEKSNGLLWQQMQKEPSLKELQQLLQNQINRILGKEK